MYVAVMWTKKKLQIKCFVVWWLQRIHLLPRIWYKCELDLGKLKVEEFCKKTGWDNST